MAGPFGSTFSLLLLLTFAVFANVSSKSEQPETLQSAFSDSSPFRSSPNHKDKRSQGAGELEDSGIEDSFAEDDEEEDEEEDESGEEYEDDEDEEDEYEFELRAMVQTPQSSTTTQDRESSSIPKPFPRPNDDVGSDKSIIQNEKNRSKQENSEIEDKDVAELLVYKNRRKGEEAEGKETKEKRVPTVKKQLSTQREILTTSNETQASKSYRINEEVLDHITEGPKSYENNELLDSENYEEGAFFERPIPQSDLNLDGEYPEFGGPGEILRKLSKSQEALLKDFNAYLLDKLGFQENLEKLFAKLTEDPKRWERAQQLLKTINADVESPAKIIEPHKRREAATKKALTVLSTTSKPKVFPKSKKPKKKKTKKFHNHRLSITTTKPVVLPLNAPLLTTTTTEKPWPSSPTEEQWGFMAGRRFRPPYWLKGVSKPDPNNSNVAKIRYSTLSKPRASPVERPIEEKQQESLEALNSERQALMLDSARDYSQPRLLHFGKINTHQTMNDDINNEMLLDFDSPPRNFHHNRFSGFAPSHGFLGGVDPNSIDRDQFGRHSVNFAENQEYQPTDRDFAASQSWQADRLKYQYPWKVSNRQSSYFHQPWNWREFPDSLNVKQWLPWNKSRDYFSRLEDEEKKIAKAAKSWHQRQQSKWKVPTSRWSGNNGLIRPQNHRKPWLEKSKTRYQQPDQHSLWEKNQTFSLMKSVENQLSSSDNEVPKLTMKTWNSLTSDPATWPFKLPGAKPWPKDQNGKSYNPNADLVRKLGLDKQSNLLLDKDAKTFKSPDNSKYKSKGLKDQKENMQVDDPRLNSWEDKASTSAKMQSVNAWVIPVDHSTWRPYNVKTPDPFDDDTNGHRWNDEPSRSDGTWSQKVDWNINKSTGVSWPPKWKQFAYHKVTAIPQLKAEGSNKPKNAFIAVSAVSQKYGNDWRKNDIEETSIPQGERQKSDNPDNPESQMKMKVWKKSTSNATVADVNVDPFKTQLEDLRNNENEANVMEENFTSTTVSSSSLESSNILKHPGSSKAETRTRDQVGYKK